MRKVTETGQRNDLHSPACESSLEQSREEPGTAKVSSKGENDVS
jgi:hypothetical protein